MAGPAVEVLGRTLEFEKSMLGYYESARDRSANPLGKGVFNLLADDKRRKARRLSEIRAALGAGEDMERACSLLACDKTAAEQFDVVAERFKGSGPPGALELTLIEQALRLEKDCLDALEQSLRAEPDQNARSFLLRAIEEGQAHYLLLSDMRYHFEHGEMPATPGKA